MQSVNTRHLLTIPNGELRNERRSANGQSSCHRELRKTQSYRRPKLDFSAGGVWTLLNGNFEQRNQHGNNDTNFLICVGFVTCFFSKLASRVARVAFWRRFFRLATLIGKNDSRHFQVAMVYSWQPDCQNENRQHCFERFHRRLDNASKGFFQSIFDLEIEHLKARHDLSSCLSFPFR